tara:strand:+ start:3426 stop:3596 length:171 start_codon:yes stop_codon:yes gene_type:complete
MAWGEVGSWGGERGGAFRQMASPASCPKGRRARALGTTSIGYERILSFCTGARDAI